jgi:thiamine-monophosphate kinase
MENTINEVVILDKWLKSLAMQTHGALSLLDDAALLNISADEELVITTDMSQEGIHFLPTMRGGLVASKVLAVNLSDLAAMGAKPLCYQLALGLTEAQGANWMDSFAVSLAEMQRSFNIGLNGGDTIKKCAALTIAITAFGTVPKGTALLRTGAKAGDDLYVSGTIGDGGLGLAFLQRKILEIDQVHSQFLERRYWYPTPRIELGIALRGVANSCMDISDGLMIDCRKLCAASVVAAEIDYNLIPLSNAAAWVRENMPTLFEDCISSGDDYELLFSAPTEKADLVVQIAAQTNTRITKIGSIKAGDGSVNLIQNNQLISLSNEGFVHY